jgi:uncharacterized protein YjbI with pentapeptide repeats
MRFREVMDGRSVQLPTLAEDELEDETATFRGEFAYDEAHLVGGDQSGVRGEGRLRRCLVSGVDLSEARLAELELVDSRLHDVDLSNATVQVDAARHVEFVGCRGIGVRLAVEQANDVVVQDCRLDHASIEVTKVKGLLVFERCSLREATLAGNLSDVVFVDCDFPGAEFAASRAERAGFPGSRLTGAWGLSTMRGARITREQAVSVADVLATEIGLVVAS